MPLHEGNTSRWRAQSLKGSLTREQFVEIPPGIAARAKHSLENMFELEKKGQVLLEKLR
jgi:hypothetical protein